MSIKLMSQVWEKDFNHSQQSILLAMADFADDNGDHCYPSIPRLAWKTGYGERQTWTIIQHLIANKVLQIVKAPTNRTSTGYKICLNMATDKAPYIPKSRDAKIATQESRDAKIAAQDATDCIPRDAKIASDPLFNHHSVTIKGEESETLTQEQNLSPLLLAEKEPEAKEEFYQTETLDLMRAWSKGKPAAKAPRVRMSASQEMLIDATAPGKEIPTVTAAKFSPLCDGKRKIETSYGETVIFDGNEWSKLVDHLLSETGLKLKADSNADNTRSDAAKAIEKMIAMSPKLKTTTNIEGAIKAWKAANPNLRTGPGYTWMLDFMSQFASGVVQPKFTGNQQSITQTNSTYKKAGELER